jgi:hypothetical protein
MQMHVPLLMILSPGITEIVNSTCIGRPCVFRMQTQPPARKTDRIRAILLGVFTFIIVILGSASYWSHRAEATPAPPVVETPPPISRDEFYAVVERLARLDAKVLLVHPPPGLRA